MTPARIRAFTATRIHPVRQLKRTAPNIVMTLKASHDDPENPSRLVICDFLCEFPVLTFCRGGYKLEDKNVLSVSVGNGDTRSV